jgi:hypothetical protein
MANIVMVTIDCANPRELAGFWTQAVGAKVTQDFEGEYLILEPEGRGPNIGLQRVDGEPIGKNRVHLDLHTEDRAAEVRRLVELGATEVEEHGMPGYAWTVLKDPAGNVFCVGAEEQLQ